MANAETKPAAPAESKPVEKQTNCLACNKPLRKLKIYYRNGKFYCNKKCWLKSKKAAETKKEEK
jgi:hypothetical protein